MEDASLRLLYRLLGYFIGYFGGFLQFDGDAYIRFGFFLGVLLQLFVHELLRLQPQILNCLIIFVKYH